MPQIKIDYIVSFSSEHPDHPASNLLSKEISGKRWVSLGKGESPVSIVFQLEKAVQISSITIGNYHSALVEVLVGKSETTDQKYEVLLCTSCFMNPGDSRNSANVANVRTFQANQLVQATQAKKWDRVRVVCTQPYNRHVQYGLSFIQFFSSDTLSNAGSSLSSSPLVSNKMLGRFKLKEDSDDEMGSLFKPGELFSKTKHNTTLPTDAEIRQVAAPCTSNNNVSDLLVKGSRPSITPSLNSSNSNETLSRKRDKIMYIDDDDKDNEKIDSIIAANRSEKAKAAKLDNEKKVPEKKINSTIKINTPKTTTSSEKKSKNQTVNKITDPSTSRLNNTLTISNDRNDRKRPNQNDAGPAEKKQCLSDNKEKTVLNVAQGDNCLKGVVFVLSGYVNPQRGILRDTAVSLGARYCPDWNQNCTHLICAFPNTPKHEQVKRSPNGGIVVTAQWIEECGNEKAHLPWQWYATDPKKRIKRPDYVLPSSSGMAVSLSKNSSNDDDDGEDTDDDIEKVLLAQAKTNGSTAKKKVPQLQMSDGESDENDELIQSPPNLIQSKIDDENEVITLSPSENEDESLIKLSPKSIQPKIEEEDFDPYSVETDSDQEKHSIKNKLKLELEETLPDLFSGIKFYVHSKISNENHDPSELKRYILAYKGDVVNTWPHKSIDVAITTKLAVDELRELKGKKCMFITPDWIWKCHDAKKLNSCEKYTIK